MPSKSPRILIGTLYCGENEFDALKHSLQEQTYPYWEHVVFKNLPNKEAHDRLYRTFMNRAGDFDLFVKLDGDMVWRSNDALRRIVEFFEQNPDLDHLTLAVRDWYSDSLIEGLHSFSNRVKWEIRNEERFVDPSPKVTGDRIKLWTDPAPLVDHSPNPAPVQAFRFGVHRALKVVQRDRWLMRYRQTRGQWQQLKKCWRHFLREGDRRLGLACLGADLTLGGHIRPQHYDREQDALEIKLQDYQSLSKDEIYDLLAPGWNSWRRKEWKYIRSVGLARLVGAASFQVAYRFKESITRQK